MLDIGSYLRISFLLILLLERGRGVEGKVLHDVIQMHDCTTQSASCFWNSSGPQMKHAVSLLGQGICRGLPAPLFLPFTNKYPMELVPPQPHELKGSQFSVPNAR